jgi:hypothetical protein
MNTLTVGINDFVLRQANEGFVGTTVTLGMLDAFAVYAQEKMNKGVYSDGYADFVRIVRIARPDVLSPIVLVTDENKDLIQTEITTRREGEEPYKHRFISSDDSPKSPSDHVNIIMYSREQLEAEGDTVPTHDWEIICITAEIDGLDAPIAPSTMRRNMNGVGGSGHQHTEEEIAESEEYWHKYVLIK